MRAVFWGLPLQSRSTVIVQPPDSHSAVTAKTQRRYGHSTGTAQAQAQSPQKRTPLLRPFVLCEVEQCGRAPEGGNFNFRNRS